MSENSSKRSRARRQGAGEESRAAGASGQGLSVEVSHGEYSRSGGSLRGSRARVLHLRSSQQRRERSQPARSRKLLGHLRSGVRRNRNERLGNRGSSGRRQTGKGQTRAGLFTHSRHGSHLL